MIFKIVGIMAVIGAIGGMIAWGISEGAFNVFVYSACGAAAAVIGYGASCGLHGTPRNSQSFVRLITPMGIATALMVGIGGVSFCSSLLENRSLNNKLQAKVEANANLDKKLNQSEQKVKSARKTMQVIKDQLPDIESQENLSPKFKEKTSHIRMQLEEGIAELTPHLLRRGQFIEWAHASAKTVTIKNPDGTSATYPIFDDAESPPIPNAGKKTLFVRKMDGRTVLFELNDEGVEIELKELN